MFNWRPTRRTSSLNSRRSGFDDLQVHLLRQAAYVVVRLDRGRRTVDRHRFDYVGIDRALRQPLHVGQLLRLCVEYFDKVAADDLAFILRFGYAF